MHFLFLFLGPLTSKLAAISLLPGLSPPTRDVGHPMSMLMDFGRACEFWLGRRHHRRPMIWDTHKVCETASCTQQNTNISPQAPFHHYLPLLHLPCIQKRAGDGSLWHFGSIPMFSTSFAGKSKPEMHLYNVLAQFPTPVSSSLTGEHSHLHLLHEQQIVF